MKTAFDPQLNGESFIVLMKVFRNVWAVTFRTPSLTRIKQRVNVTDWGLVIRGPYLEPQALQALALYSVKYLLFLRGFGNFTRGLRSSF